MSGRRILFVTSEAYPLIKTGGLADYASGLVKALVRRGHDVRVLLPAYSGAAERLANTSGCVDLGDTSGAGPTALICGKMPDSGHPVWLLDCPRLYRRAGGVYQDTRGADWPDNGQRFGLLALVAARLALGGATSWRPDVVHLNEWQTGPAAALLSLEAAAPPTLFTIHNMAFQGLFNPDVLSFLGLPQSLFATQGLEFYGQVSFLKAGIRYARRIATVSEAYAQEILTPEFGFGLEGLLAERARDLIGILNGADYELWDPRSDRHLAQSFGPDDVAPGKRHCKAALRRRLALAERAETPVLAFISRMTHQKMADVLADVMPQVLARGVQVVVLGQGDPAMEHALRALTQRFTGELAVHIGYDEALAHQLLAGADALLAPARFEPCGLTQMYALRYGTVPIVSRVGGLKETVVDASPQSIADRTATGFVFDVRTGEAMLAAIDRALGAYRDEPTWCTLQRSGMQVDFSWERTAARYEQVYEELVAARAAPDVREHEAAALPG